MKDDRSGEDKKRTEEEKRKKAPRPKKSVRSGLGGLPSMKDAKRTTTDQDSRVARSMGGTAVAPGMHQMGGLPGLTPTMMPPSHAGAKMVPPSSIMASIGPQGGARSGKGRSHVASGTKTRGEPYGWKFQDVPTLPEFHPLERTAVFVPHSDAPEVGRRVADVLRARSIAAEYDDQKAKCKCITEDNVDFRVRLYRGRNKFSHGVIVEVQRRFGFSPSFADDMYAILDAAEGKLPAPKTLPPIPLPDQLIPVVSDVDDDDDFDEFDVPPPTPSLGGKRKAGASLQIASDMLKHAKTADANVLALESLSSLTDPKKMGNSAALRVSRQILTGSDGGEDVRDAVVSLLIDRSLDTCESTADVWDEDEEGMAELRLHAMTVLSNAISVAASSGSPALLKDQAAFLAEDIMPVLVDELREAKANPRMAVAASRCLKASLTSKAIGRDMSNAACECDAESALEKALDVGQRGNDNLAEVSDACLKVLS